MHKGVIVDEHLSDIGSGLNYNRPKWNQLLHFVRFGFDWFANFCKRHGSEIVVVNNPKSSPDRELVDDLVSIIHVFSCRLYGLRRYKSKIEKDPNLKGGNNK